MPIRVAVQHATSYRYDRSIRLGPQSVRLRPAPHCRTPVHAYSLRIEPREHFLNWQQDPQGNFVARIVFPETVRSFEIHVELIAELSVVNPFDFFLEPYAERFPFSYAESLAPQLAPYLDTTEEGPLFEELLASVDMRERRTVDFLVELNRLVEQRLEYLLRMDPGVQTPEGTLERGSGSCRDFAWLEVQLLRRLGLAARFVSGYSVQLRPDEKPLEGPAGVAEDVVDLHAWAEVYVPGAGWIGMDPTSGLLAGEGHIPLACTPEPAAAAPVEGEIEASEVEHGFSMSVARVLETPRATKPFEDGAWQRILEAGDEVDRRLVEADVRLTMGGEPTFVSVDDLVGEEWTVAANGTEKRRLSEELMWRLRGRFAAGSLLHVGQGKWYPGESLPRWALTCLWRRDGEPVWRDDRLLQRGDLEGTCEQADLVRFLERLCVRLGVDPEWVMEAYEDVAYFLWRENRLPVGIDPRDPKIEDAEERARLARVFERGLGAPAGLVLPLERRGQGEAMVWHSSLWMLRAKHLFLSPGDSQVGMRLPLDSLVRRSAVAPHLYPDDPLAPRAPLPPRSRLGATRRQETVDRQEAETRQQARTEQPDAAVDPDAGDVVQTALCAEIEGGRLSIFLPPTRTVDDYLDLIAAVEETAAELDLPVVVGGYLPPTDPRLESLKITPDPGVIEVNVQPVASWRQQVELTTALYEEARASRLQAIKYLVDGREVGTGGGNHIVLGGSTPADSPFLRRPDLVRSLVGWWNNHPSLSYVFSSLFLGPTSQAPRMDEGRDDIVYEMELAFRELDRQPAPAPPWLVDRIFRHLLVDVSGNTHRAELCIDKLYSPDSASGRLGLVEFRCFEMTPHARMNLVQQLLLRAIVGYLWTHPFKGSLVRWSTELHDRFQLPYFLRRDLAELLAELREGGFPIEDEWFEPQLEFRFPILGEVAIGEVVIELRPALEPWHVLGEEPGGGGTVRYVDSSVERLQVTVRGLPPDRYAITCNGRRLPLQAGRQRGRFVAGVRFRAWQPAHCLHPTIGVHSPLVFDLVDLRAGRSVGGCTYHVGHPGGRSYDEPPVNALEAESRRRARFEPLGHTAGTSGPLRAEDNPEFPMTLDLRR